MFDSSGLAKFISASRIVHSLPGRIRIHIPILEKLPSGWLTYSEHTAELIKMRNGIEDVKIRPVTGSLIICYDPDQIGESEILTWLKTLVETFLSMEITSKSINEADIRLRFARVRDWFSQNGTAQHFN
jgi:hypothetical protein